MLASACAPQPSGPLAVAPGSAKALCINSVNGASWRIAIDEIHRRADGLPARFDADRIAWRNPADTGEYELKRATGELTITRPSSTGGYIMSYRCKAVR
jgi:hypothetical protein